MTASDSFLAKLLLLTVSILCFACAPIDPSVSATIQALQTNPPPTPEFVIEADRIKHVVEDADVCIYINQRPLWHERYYTPSEATNHIFTTLRFTIDGRAVPPSDVLSSVNAMAYPIFDENREIIGLFGGIITSCAPVDNLSRGLHLVTVDFATIWSREYSYSWVLEIE